MRIRNPAPEELPALSALCFRSKAVWGYDDAFMEACREELTIDPKQLDEVQLAVAEAEGQIMGVAQLFIDGEDAELDKLFIEPAHLKSGVGRMLFNWAVRHAVEAGAKTLIVQADPGAVPFYRRMGAYQIGESPSGSIPGRNLPVLAYDLPAS